ncbi:MAG: hypothetical protein QNJ22_07745 [Desulfosarcinaceae bacterium]|nr:hypothetical protein [Desulfosarcinaceae bacterium]
MGRIEKDAQGWCYRQPDGTITARFDTIAEKRVLAHTGSRFYQRVFAVLVIVGAVYLSLIFWLR